MKTYALKNMTILNGHIDMTPIVGKVIIVEDGKFKAITDSVPNNLSVIDLDGKYILPGLINMHVHIPSSGKPKKGKTNYNAIASLLRFSLFRSVVRKMCANYAKQQLLSGTTTIRAVGGLLDFDTTLRDQINSGAITGPRILAANYAVSVPGGHMTGSVALPAHSPEEAAKMVEDIAKTKPDLIKLMITGGVLDAEVPGEPGVLKMPPEYVKAACDKAHELGYKVAAHVESNEGMVVALENGVDTIEHGGKPSAKVMELFKKTGAVLIATLSPAIPFAIMDQSVTGFTDTDLINARALFTNMVQCIKECLANEIPVGLGTDAGCPFITHYDTWRELWYYNKLIGVSPEFAIHSATELNARIAAIDDVTGSIDEGKSADFMVVSQNPLEDLQALQNIDMVAIKGNIIENPRPKKFDIVEKNLQIAMDSL